MIFPKLQGSTNMGRKVQLGRVVGRNSATGERSGYTLRDSERFDDDESKADSGESTLSRYLNYVIAAMVLIILLVGLLNLVVGGTPHHGPIMAEIEKENVLAGIESPTDREQIKAQALRVDRAEALGNTAQIRQELETLMMMGRPDPQSPLHQLCVKRLRSLK
jgi:hypothetical protein